MNEFPIITEQTFLTCGSNEHGYKLISIPSRRATSIMVLVSSVSQRFNPTGMGSIRLSVRAAVRYKYWISLLSIIFYKIKEYAHCSSCRQLPPAHL